MRGGSFTDVLGNFVQSRALLLAAAHGGGSAESFVRQRLWVADSRRGADLSHPLVAFRYGAVPGEVLQFDSLQLSSAHGDELIVEGYR